MNIPLSKQQIKELPLGLTSNTYANRRQRRMKKNETFIKPSKNYPILVNQLSNNSFSKVLRIRQLIDKKDIVKNKYGKIESYTSIKPKYIEHYKLLN